MNYGWMGVLALAACAGTSQDPAARDADRQRLVRCGAIEVYPSGLQPTRPYRVLGPVQVASERIVSSRDRALRDRACALGADAIIDVAEEPRSHQPQVPTSGALISDELVASGTAVAFTDVSAPAPAPASAR